MNQTLGQTRGQLAEGGRQIQALRQQLDTQAQALLQLAMQLADAEKQLTDKQTLMREQHQRWQQQQEQDQVWFARRISEEKQFAEDKLKDKLELQALQIAALKESETALQNTCTRLQQELRQSEAALAESQKKMGRCLNLSPKIKPNRKKVRVGGG